MPTAYDWPVEIPWPPTTASGMHLFPDLTRHAAHDIVRGMLKTNQVLHFMPLVFIELAGDNPRMREIADKVGITERAVQRHVTELRDAGVVKVTRTGRRNSYEIVDTELLAAVRKLVAALDD